MVKKVIYAVIAVILLIFGKFLLQGDFSAFMQWWATIALMGIVFMPLTVIIFSDFHDKGYIFSKAIGIAVTGYFMWFFSSVHLMRFTPLSCLICAAIGIVFNAVILVYQKLKGKGLFAAGKGGTVFNGKLLDHIITEELLFLALFILFTYIRGFKPEAHSTEKFMDYGFMTSMMRSDYMPPQDFWFSGTKLNYYYVGQFFATFLTKLSHVRVNDGYNLMLMMVGALAFVLVYSLCYNIILQFMKEKDRKGKFIPGICGLIGGLAVCIAGNMHYPVYQWLEPAVRKFFGMEASTDKYWFPDATRFIGYHPETKDKTIHEFPSYSFVLGDLHAHVINIFFVLTVLGALFAWMIHMRKAKRENVPIWKEVFHPAIILISFFIGLFHTTNYWDFPIYFVVSGAIILFTNLVVYNLKALWLTALQGVVVLAISELTSLAFTLNFDQISTNICITFVHTPLNQLIILWGLPIFITVAFICFVISDYRNMRKEAKEKKEKLPRGKGIPAHFLQTISPTDLFIILLGLCAMGLVLLPELVYVEDIYSSEFKRANTMFKLTYQAFIMFGISFGYILLRLLMFGRTRKQRKYAIIGLLIFATSVTYIQNAVNGWYGNIFDRKGYKGLDAAAFMATSMPDDAGAIDWLNNNLSGMPVVLEANGDSYSDYQRVSVMTGLPTILGWRTHEWLWKSDTTYLKIREEAIETIYTSTDEAEVRKLLDEYNVSYIYVGNLEKDKFPSLNNSLLKQLGQVVYSSTGNLKDVNGTYIIKLNRN